MQMRKMICSPSLAFDSTQVKYGVRIWPNLFRSTRRLMLFSTNLWALYRACFDLVGYATYHLLL